MVRKLSCSYPNDRNDRICNRANVKYIQMLFRKTIEIIDSVVSDITQDSNSYNAFYYSTTRTECLILAEEIF